MSLKRSSQAASRKTANRSTAPSDLSSDGPAARIAASPMENEPIERPSRSKPRPLGPGLALVATPIGNLGDITLRAIEALRTADLLVCEDTRVTRKLLTALGIDRPLLAYHEHNAAEMRPRILARLAEGASVALCSDAGTPLVSDPGYKLVKAAVEAGHAVTALPGASAPLAALAVAGQPTDRFLFAGFLPARSAARRRELESLAGVPATLVILESARRLPESLADMAAVLGPRPAAVARELTKLHEETRRAPLDRLAADYAASGPPKGEVVVVVAPPAAPAEADEATLDALLTAALADDSLRGAVDRVAAETGLPRRRVYQRALVLRGPGSPEGS